MTGPDEPGARRPGATFWISAAVGWAIILFGLRGLFHHHIDTRPSNLARFVVGGALGHDLLFAPVVLAAGVVTARVLPRRLRPFVQAGLFITGCLMLFAYPLVRGFGHAVHNPSSVPHNYTANLAIVLGGLWLVVAVVAVVSTGRGRRRGTASPTPGGPDDRHQPAVVGPRRDTPGGPAAGSA